MAGAVVDAGAAAGIRSSPGAAWPSARVTARSCTSSVLLLGCTAASCVVGSGACSALVHVFLHSHCMGTLLLHCFTCLHRYCRFAQYPELLQVGTRFVFRDGRCKGIGKIVNVGIKTNDDGSVAGSIVETLAARSAAAAASRAAGAVPPAPPARTAEDGAGQMDE